MADKTDPVDAVLTEMDAAVSPAKEPAADPKDSAAAGGQAKADPPVTTAGEKPAATAEPKPSDSGDHDLGRLTRAANELRLAKEASQAEARQVASDKAALDAASQDFEKKVSQTKDTYKRQITLGAAIEQMQSREMDAAELVRLVYGDDVDLSKALESLTKGAGRPVTAADLRNVREQAAREAIAELDKRTLAQKEADTRAAAEADARHVSDFKKAADQVMAASGDLLAGDAYPRLKERLGDLPLGYTHDFVASDGRRLLTFGDKLLTILNEHVKRHGKPMGLPDALKELEDSLGPKAVETPPNGVKQPASNGTKVPSASQRAGAGTRAPNDPKAKDFVEREWDDLIEEITKLEAGSRK